MARVFNVLFISMLLLITACSVSSGERRDDPPAATVAVTASASTEAAATAPSIPRSEGPALPLSFVEYFDPGCPLCAEMKPVVAALQEAYAHRLARFEVVDITTEEGRKQADAAHVMMTPTFLLLEGDKELDRMVGVVSSQNIVRFMDRGLDEVSRGQ